MDYYYYYYYFSVHLDQNLNKNSKIRLELLNFRNTISFELTFLLRYPRSITKTEEARNNSTVC